MTEASATGSIGTSEEDYGAAYYATYSDHGGDYSWDHPAWRAFFRTMATQMVDLFPVKRSLDVGCAKGLFVQALAELDVDSAGIDISSFAISAADPAVQDRLSVRSAIEPFEGRYDLISCIEVIEHMAPDAALAAIANICASTDRVLFSSSPADFDEATHVNTHPTADWVAAFAVHGFYRRTDVDLSGFITPWAVLFERSEATTRDIVHRYESLLSPIMLELAGKKAALRDAAKTHAAAAADEVLRARHDLLTTRDHILGLEAENATLRRSLDHERAWRRHAQKRVQDMLGSRSWKIGRAVVVPLTLGRRRAQ